MGQFEKVCKGLQTAVDSDWMWRKADYIAMCCKDALAMINAQRERINELEAAQQWISVKDRLPEKSGTYLCYQPKAADICALNTVRWSTQLGWMGKEVGSRIEGIEYWMPLPEPPKEEEHDAD